MSATETKSQFKIQPLRFWQSINLGCDPEFFFASKDGKTVGSEKIIPKEGLVCGDGYAGKCVIDGVQAELNPSPSFCRESLAYQISRCFFRLKSALSNGVKVVADPVVDITQEELDSLSEGSRVFGCAPSTNVYNEGNDKTSKIAVDPKKYLKRSAGGHIHLGNFYSGYMAANYKNAAFNSQYQIGLRQEKALKETPEITVRMLDYILGNTAVMIDRNANNAERRKNYGRCGEYRIKSYGLEYRTLSNFWLRSYPLFSMIFGLARFAIHLVEQSTKDNDYVKTIFEAVPQEDIIKAIQTNDFDLAYANFKKLDPIIRLAAGAAGSDDRYYPLKDHTMVYFLHFVKKVKEVGLEYWFPQDAFSHWTGVDVVKNEYIGEPDREVYNYNKRGGWENFAYNIVRLDMENEAAMDLNKPAENLKKVKVKVKAKVTPVSVG